MLVLDILDLSCLLVNLIPAGIDLLLLCCPQMFIGLPVGLLILLSVNKVCLEGLLHLLQDAEDLTRLRSIRKLQCWRCINVMLWRMNAWITFLST